MNDKKIIPLEDRIPKLKEQRRKKTNRRFIFYITLFFVLILIIVYVQSPLSRISHFVIKGNNYTAKTKIISKTKLADHPHFWDVNTKDVTAETESIPTIKKAEVHKSFPGTITINVSEYQRIAYLDKNGVYFPILENGTLRDKLSKNNLPVNAPILIGWNDNSTLDKMAEQLSKTPAGILHAISEIHLSQDDPSHNKILLFMNNGLKVIADISSFAKNIKAYPGITENLPKNAKGTIHLQLGSYFEPDEKPKKAN